MIVYCKPFIPHLDKVYVPLSLRKPTKSDFQPLLNKVYVRLQRWQTGMLSRGRLVLAKMVLTARPIYAFMALAPPLWVIKEIDKRH